jgi:hypothetical protein
MAEADEDYEKNDISASKKSGAFFARKTKYVHIFTGGIGQFFFINSVFLAHFDNFNLLFTGFTQQIRTF